MRWKQKVKKDGTEEGKEWQNVSHFQFVRLSERKAITVTDVSFSHSLSLSLSIPLSIYLIFSCSFFLAFARFFFVLDSFSWSHSPST